MNKRQTGTAPHDVVCTFDENYAQHCGVMLTSLLENNRLSRFHLHLVHNGLSQKSTRRFMRLGKRYGVVISYYHINDNQFGEAVIKEGDHVSIVAYFRLLLPKILPATVDRILYLDPDMVVRDDISELLNIELGAHKIAAAVDLLATFQGHGRALGLPEDQSYFNSGVLVLSMNEWRRLDLSFQLLQTLAEVKSRIKYWDQDVFNVMLGNDFKPINPRWNVVDVFLTDPKAAEVYGLSDQDYREIVANPGIFHFIGPNVCKPWFEECRNPLRGEYRTYLRRSPWRGAPLQRLTPAHRYEWIGRIVNRFKSAGKRLLGR